MNKYEIKMNKKSVRKISVSGFKIIFGFICIALMCFNRVQAQNPAVINLDSTHQVIRGFGAANILPWRPDMTQSEINKAFGTDDGQLGFSILRLRLPSDENSFSANLSTAKAAYSMGVTLIASPWSPPASMKTNNNIVDGQLSESKYADYAAYLNKFTDYMANNGAPVYAVSVQNEPDITVTYESCDWSPDQMLKFVKENAGIIKTKVIAPESFQFRRDMSDPILNDSVACANLDIVGGHIYGGGLAAYPLAESKGKEVWMTEHLVLETAWQDNLATGKEILDCMHADMSAYIWWYIVRFYGPIYDEGSDSRTPAGAVKGEISKRGYVMSQFSRFVRPGFKRVDTYYSPQRTVYTVAFKDSSTSKVVIIAINTSTQDLVQPFSILSGKAGEFIPYVTSSVKNCEKGNSIQATDQGFTATLEASSITTFVSAGSAVPVDGTSTIPDSYKLMQNYPNPFNPTTAISFVLPESSYVSLDLVNLLGQEVKSIAEGVYTAGTHQVVLDASGLSSGTYFYRLVTDKFIGTKKLMLIK